jgi:opacity protein-like surface antigen
MWKPIAFALLLVIGGVAQSAAAQQEFPKLEVYGGYYYVRFNINADLPGVPASQTFNANGGGGQVEYNINHWLGVVGDFAGYGAMSTVNGALVGGAFTYLFGPRVNFRHGIVTPFAQALFGGIATTSGIGTSGDENNFALTGGGGFDFKISKHISVRPIQAEYLMAKLPNGLNNRENNFRIGAGVVLRLGK